MNVIRDFRDKVLSQVRIPVDNKVERPLRIRVDKEIWNEVWVQVGDQVRGLFGRRL